MEDGGTLVTAQLADTAIGLRLDRALADALPDLSRERIKALLGEGAVRDGDNRALSNASAKIIAPMTVHITLPAPIPATAQPQQLPLDVVYEDEHLIVVDKAAGMVVHPANGNPDGTLVNALLHHCAGQLSGIGGVARPGIVHRIDKDTSGLLVVAKSDVAHEGLARQFADHSISRVYRAFVHGHPMPMAATIDAPLGRSSHDRLKMAVVDADRGKRAVTRYTTRTNFVKATDVECRLETGRTHQVRVHMAHIGHPLVGDPIYCRSDKSLRSSLQTIGFARQALHAAHLGFIHPVTGDRVGFDSDLPPDMQALFTVLKGSSPDIDG
jgi:23S rRNA pseudouridine1911/1915/1917 synthase